MRDASAFRERFKQWKATGELPYEAGLPKYKVGKDPDKYSEDELIEYLGALENPGKVGLKGGVWRPPTDSTRYDTHQIGMGLDIRQEHNPIVYNFLKSKGRLNNPYLTVEEERMLRKKTWAQKKPILDRFLKSHDLSERGIFTAAGMLWQGHPYKMMNTPDSITGKALQKAIDSGNKDLDTVFDAYYGYGSNSKRYQSRINANRSWWKAHPQQSYTETEDVDYSEPQIENVMRNAPQYKPTPLYTPVNTQYPINNPAPQSVSSWSSGDSPAQKTRSFNILSDLYNLQRQLSEIGQGVTLNQPQRWIVQ